MTNSGKRLIRVLVVLSIIVLMLLMQNSLSILASKTVLVKKITLNTKILNLKAGETQILKATVYPSNASSKKVKWTTSDKDVATVTTSGKVVAIAEGRAIITAKSNNGKKAMCKVTVEEEKVTGITLNEHALTLTMDDSFMLTAKITPESALDAELTWSSDDEDVAVVDDEGNIFPIEVGTATITVEAENDVSDSCIITITDNGEEIEDTNDTEDTNGIEDTNGTKETNDTKSIEETNDTEDVSNVTDHDNNSTENSSTNNGQDPNIGDKSKGIVSPVRVTMIDSDYKIILKDTNVCLDVSGSGNTNGTNVQVYESNLTNAQIWHFENHSDGTVSLIPRCAADKVLDVMRTNNSVTGALKAGCNIDIYNHNDAPAQNFYVDQFHDGSYILRLSSNSNLVLTAGGTGNGANVIIDTYNENSSLQRWSIDPAKAETRRTAYVFNTGGDGVFVRSEGSSSAAKIGGFAESQEITVIGEIQNGWYHVEGKDRNTGNTINGYSYGDYITFTQDSFQTKINAEITKFPNGAYWSHVGGTNNPDGYTWTPCSSAHTDCNCFSNAWQCHGFALKLGYDIFGSDPRTWSKVYTLDHLHPGDIIRYTKSSYAHTVFVTAVSGDTITIADCNSDFHCIIRWNHQMKKSSITGLNYVLTLPNS